MSLWRSSDDKGERPLAAPVCALVVGEGDSRIADALRNASIAVESVMSGPAALTYVASRLPTDVVVIDLTGVTEPDLGLISAIREHGYWRFVPVLVAMPDCASDYVSRAFEAGVDEFLSNPGSDTVATRVLDYVGVA